MSVAFAMTMGPREADMVIDNLQAIEALYPDAVTWVRDDATSDGTWERVSEWAEGKRVRLSRNSSPKGYFHIAQTHAALLLDISDTTPSLVIKIDPDAVLLRTGLEELFRARFGKYGSGICGSYRLSPTGTPRNFTLHRLAIMLDMLPVGPQFKVKKHRLRPVGYFKYLLRALRNGYEIGENVQGGLYAIDGDILGNSTFQEFLRSVAYGQRGLLWTDDVLFPLGVKAVGGTISPLNEGLVDIPTHIQAFAPLVLDPAMVEAGHLLAVHPVKQDAEEQRSFYRSIRERSSASVGPVAR